MTPPLLERDIPEAVGLDPVRWDRVLQTAERLCAEGTVPALSMQVQRRGKTTGVHCFGHHRLDGTEPVDEHTLFPVASLTKPMVAMAVLLLVERGQLALNQRVVEILPEFSGSDRRPVTLRHLLTHTSGLPDMLPNNLELRRRQVPNHVFAAETCRIDLHTPPGRTAVYQSMGYALLGEIIERVTGIPYRRFLRSELFEPLGMLRTWLGLPEDLADAPEIAEVRVPDEQAEGTDWNWNSRYWRTMGAPWGGGIATTEDLSRFCRCMLTGGALPPIHGVPAHETAAGAARLFSPATVRLATTNRLRDFSTIPALGRDSRGWGFGWRMNWQDHWSGFCDLLSGEAYGHWGATGTLFWIDPETDAAAVILTTQPIGRQVAPHVRLSNMIAAAWK